MGAVRRVAWQSPMLNRAPLPTGAAVPAIGGTLAHQPAVSSAIAEKPVRVDFFGVSGLAVGTLKSSRPHTTLCPARLSTIV